MQPRHWRLIDNNIKFLFSKISMCVIEGQKTQIPFQFIPVDESFKEAEAVGDGYLNYFIDENQSTFILEINEKTSISIVHENRRNSDSTPSIFTRFTVFQDGKKEFEFQGFSTFCNVFAFSYRCVYCHHTDMMNLDLNTKVTSKRYYTCPSCLESRETV